VVAGEVLDDAGGLAPEVVATAVEHAPEEGDIDVRVEFSDGRLRVEVRDPGPGFTHVPRAENAGANDRGWGLVFIDRVATRWANDRGCVWFELERS
jgi:anti-sigma regulatory factor (Ser/Thr protein kinase)